MIVLIFITLCKKSLKMLKGVQNP